MPTNSDLLLALNQQVPRYTSYPTAQEFVEMAPKSYRSHLQALSDSQRPLSLYFHIPFCRTMCLFCACSVILNRSDARQKLYVDSLLQEIALVRSQFVKSPLVKQIHFGGGTPTQLSEEDLSRLMQAVSENFTIDRTGEIAMEIDPRTVQEGSKLRLLRRLGFNRVSFGVQDLAKEVQEAVKRRQTAQMTERAYFAARDLGFEGINIDLIYGLPKQTQDSFARTAEQIIALRPDRIAFFSYARVPWLKPHQKAIAEADLPSTDEKFAIYLSARAAFLQAGYEAIGMDHFALPTDNLTQAYHNRGLTRNFQGYAPKLTEDLIGMGVTAIGDVAGGYFQNIKELEQYHESLAARELPVLRGRILNEEDHKRRYAIMGLMCHFELRADAFYERFKVELSDHFAAELQLLGAFAEQGMVTITAEGIFPTELGRLFIRNLATVFDAYRKTDVRDAKPFSRAI